MSSSCRLDQLILLGEKNLFFYDVYNVMVHFICLFLYVWYWAVEIIGKFSGTKLAPQPLVVNFSLHVLDSSNVPGRAFWVLDTNQRTL